MPYKCKTHEQTKTATTMQLTAKNEKHDCKFRNMTAKPKTHKHQLKTNRKGSSYLETKKHLLIDWLQRAIV